MSEKPKRWIIGQPGGITGPFYSVVRQDGRIIAMQIPDAEVARQIALLPIIRWLGEEARKYHINHGERGKTKAYKDLFDVLSKLVEPK